MSRRKVPAADPSHSSRGDGGTFQGISQTYPVAGSIFPTTLPTSGEVPLGNFPGFLYCHLPAPRVLNNRGSDRPVDSPLMVLAGTAVLVVLTALAQGGMIDVFTEDDRKCLTCYGAGRWWFGWNRYSSDTTSVVRRDSCHLCGARAECPGQWTPDPNAEGYSILFVGRERKAIVKDLDR